MLKSYFVQIGFQNMPIDDNYHTNIFLFINTE